MPFNGQLSETQIGCVRAWVLAQLALPDAG
jgi:hypothetical protein